MASAVAVTIRLATMRPHWVATNNFVAHETAREALCNGANGDYWTWPWRIDTNRPNVGLQRIRLQQCARCTCTESGDVDLAKVSNSIDLSGEHCSLCIRHDDISRCNGITRQDPSSMPMCPGTKPAPSPAPSANPCDHALGDARTHAHFRTHRRCDTHRSAGPTFRLPC